MRDQKRPVKTESLSLRLDPKTKFILDFVVRAKGVRVTDLVGRAIKEMADATWISGQDIERKRWVDYWHPEEGVRVLNIIMDPEMLKRRSMKTNLPNLSSSIGSFFILTRVVEDP